MRLQCSAWLAGLALAVALPVQAAANLTEADYAHAEQFMGYNTEKLVSGRVDQEAWLPSGRLFYRVTTPDGPHFVLVKPGGARAPAFDLARIASALSAPALAPSGVQFSENERQVSFDFNSKRYTCEVQGRACREIPSPNPNDTLSPDGKRAAFIRDFNLWVRDLQTGKETQLTTDGVKDFGYATDNTGWQHTHRAIVSWSPDSKRLFTYQQDQRLVGDMYLVSTTPKHPKLETWKYAMAGDEHIAMVHRVIIDVAAKQVIRLPIPPDPHRSSACYDVSCGNSEVADTQWSADSATVAFISTSRDHKQAQLRIADAKTGAVREVLEESVPSFYESDLTCSGDCTPSNGGTWRYLSASHEIIWLSERSNWAHLYLYDARNGRLKNAITSGDWLVTKVLHVDEKARELYVVGLGHEKGRDPYFAHVYRVSLDGKHIKLLTPQNANHEVLWSPSNRYFLDTYSTPTVAPVTVIRDTSGKVVQTLERADVSRLMAAGWQPPVPITVKARDGKTDLYGLMFRPTQLDETRRYPIINYIYPGPIAGSVGTRSFRSARGDRQALAELGFIVVAIDGMGTAYRAKSVHDAYTSNLGDNTLPDQIAGMKQLAQRFSYIDLERAGIYGHSGGGYATGAAMFRYPEFFKVGVSESGNHDQRGYTDDWAEKFMGLEKRNADGSSNYDAQSNLDVAKNLRGHLLLMHGTGDDNVPPNLTFSLVERLIEANKDFDLIVLPNQAHAYRGKAAAYAIRRRWDYFVRYLLGVEPPKAYLMHSSEAP